MNIAYSQLHANTGVMQTMPVVLNSGLSVRAKAQKICHKKRPWKALETKKKLLKKA